MKKIIIAIFFLFSFNIFAKINRVVFIGIDGVGSHNLWRGPINGVASPVVPNINKLKSVSAWTTRAQIDQRNWSGPNWVGMITGSNSQEHGVHTNNCDYSKEIPSIYQIIKEQKPNSKITLIYDWSKIKCHAKGGGVDKFRPTIGTTRITKRALMELKENNPTLLFVYYGQVDIKGHQHGGASKEYKKALEEVDKGVGEIIDYINSSDLIKDTIIILTSDHGHHPTLKEHSSSEFPVPLFLMGPGIIPGEIFEEVRNNQVSAIISFSLGLNPSSKWSSSIENLESYFSQI